MTQETATAEIKIGQPVVISLVRGWDQFGYKVVRVTNAGQIVVGMTIGKERRFGKNCREIGGNAMLHFDVENRRQQAEHNKLLGAAANAIDAVRVKVGYSGWSTKALQELVAELETKLAAAKEKLAICASESPEQK